MTEPSASALRVAVKALSRRELSTAELRARLARAGIDPDEAAAVTDYLRATGYLDDGRAAAERARVLAGRQVGNAAITADLARRGVQRDDIELALADLPSELDRGLALARRLGGGERLARALRTKGYSGETIEWLLGGAVADEP